MDRRQLLGAALASPVVASTGVIPEGLSLATRSVASEIMNLQAKCPIGNLVLIWEDYLITTRVALEELERLGVIQKVFQEIPPDDHLRDAIPILYSAQGLA